MRSNTAGTAVHQRYLDTRHFASLDGLRCLSIVPVIWHHSTPYPYPGLLGRGPAGVDLFFCISGFLITTLLLREKSEQGRIAFRAFYWRRALRILPLFYATLLGYLIFALVQPESEPSRAHFFEALPFYATFTANWFVNFAVPFPVMFSFAWSLCVEQQFYAFWPGLVNALKRGGALAAMAALVGIDLLLQRGMLISLDAQSVAFRVVTSVATPIGMGAMLALLLDAPYGFRVLRHLLGHAASAPLALVAVIACLADPGALGVGYQLALAALVGSCVIREQHGLRVVLVLPALVYLGQISYGLYLLHPGAIGLVRLAFPQYCNQAAVVFASSFPLALLFAASSHRLLEMPLRRLRGHYRPRPRGHQLSATRHDTSNGPVPSIT